MVIPRHELLGRYHTPRFRIGDNLLCAIRGTVRVVGVSDGLIPWPIELAEGSRARSYVICGDLEKAPSVEAGSAVAHRWGVRRLTVSKWRKALGLTEATAGTKRLRAANDRSRTRSWLEQKAFVDTACRRAAGGTQWRLGGR